MKGSVCRARFGVHAARRPDGQGGRTVQGAATQLHPVSRKDADDLFLESLLTQPEAVGEATAHAMYAGVHLGGESSWRADTTVQQPDLINQMILPVEPWQQRDAVVAP